MIAMHESSNVVFALLLLSVGGAAACTATDPNPGSAAFTGGNPTAPASGGGSASGAGNGGAATGGGSAGVGGSVVAGTGGALAAGGLPAVSGDGGGSGSGLAGAGGSGGNAVVPTGPHVDAPGMFCDDTSLWLGDMHLFTNKWNDMAAMSCVFLNQDGTFGWNWDMSKTVGKNPSWPNYPELEFGINPWNTLGLDKSTTMALPKQLKDILSASMTVDVSSDISGGNWNLAFELWLTDVNPETAPAGTSKPEAEMMVFLSNKDGYYPADPKTASTVSDGDKTYKLYETSDDWDGHGQKYRQWRLNTSTGKFSGKLDIGKFLKFHVDSEHWDTSWWVTRFELGNEAYQGSVGTTRIKSLTFDVNGESHPAKTMP